MKSIITSVLTAASMLAAPTNKIDQPVDASAVVATPEATSKVVQVSERDVVTITTKMRFTTMIVLPKEEQILDFVCGDKEFWVVNGSQNFAFIKPARENGQTNLNLITASGNVYSFTLTEGGKNAHPDLKVFVELKGDGLLSAINGQPRFVAKSAISDYEHQVELANAKAKKAKDDASAQVEEAKRVAAEATAKARESFPASLQFDYKYKAQDVFAVSSIYHDDKFTYIAANPQESPALYELKDGRGSVIEFQYANGLYTVPKLLDHAYLQIGRQKMYFNREKN